MYTTDIALESLQKYDIHQQDLLNWEKELGLQIPVDEYGRKSYSPHHINLFKNVKKHIALGRTLDEIKDIITLPPMTDSRPVDTHHHDVAALQAMAPEPVMPHEASELPVAESFRQPEVTQTENELKLSPAKILASGHVHVTIPEKPVVNTITTAPPMAASARPVHVSPARGNADKVVELVNKLTAEKDHLFKKLIETEKLNSHLYSANSMYHAKLKELTASNATLTEQLKEQQSQDETIKLMDDKSKLQKQLLDAEKNIQEKEKESQTHQQTANTLRQQITLLEDRIKGMTQRFDVTRFCGDWMETGQLIEVSYDNFGINIESERVRLFRVSQQPERVFGNTAVIATSYQYENNSLWKRNETLVVALVDDNTLEGEVTAEYVLDGVPVARAVYHVTCGRNA